MSLHADPLVDQILSPYADLDLHGYKNHVLRLINFACSMERLDDDGRNKVTIAACFHDLGLFTEKTLDYLPPSMELARAYLEEQGLNRWTDEISTMIDQHHRVRRITGEPLVELFRRADLADFSLGVLAQGVSRSRVREIKRAFPNSGFHRHLVRTACWWVCRHPLNPVPVLKW